MAGAGRFIRAVFPVALVCSAFVALLAASPVPAAVHERVTLSLPDPGQLSAARLQFKVKGDKRPELKLKLKNTRDLPGSLIGAAQMTRSTERKGRAVAFLSFANVPTATRRAPRVINEQALIDVSSTATRTKIDDIQFQNLPSASRNFASVLGLEPGSERRQAQETFGISENRVPDDAFGRIDIDEIFELADLKKVQETKIVSQPTFADEIRDLYRQWGVSSAIAAALGPPAVLDAELYALVSGLQAPFVLQSTFGPSQSNPSLYFSAVQYDIPVMGAQLSQASDLDLMEGPDARCQNGFLEDGVFTRGVGPLLPSGFGYAYRCEIPRDSPTVFADVPLERVPAPGIDLFKFMPFPFYGSDDIGEAVGGEQTTVVVRSP